MNISFTTIPEDKKQRILNAAMQEFAAKGYARASTNAIVLDAGIAKGLLFHYFGNKKQLFLYVYDYCIDLTLHEFYARLDQQERDMFRKLSQVQAVKLELLSQYPRLYQFLQKAYLEQAVDVRDEVSQRVVRLLKVSMAQLFTDIDYKPFKPGIDPAQALKILIWVLEGYTNELVARAEQSENGQFAYEEALQAMNQYLTLLQTCFYRQP